LARSFGHFVSNLRGRDVIGLILGLVCLGFAVRADVRSGLWTMTVPALVFGAALGYPLRNLLVEHCVKAAVAMNGLLAGCWLLQFLIPKEMADHPVARISLSAFIGFYLSCYYLLLSDTQVGRED
jgi:hypothetical protein